MFLKKVKVEEKIVLQPIFVERWVVEPEKFQRGTFISMEGFRIMKSDPIFPFDDVEGFMKWDIDRGGTFHDDISIVVETKDGFHTSFRLDEIPSSSQLFSWILERYQRWQEAVAAAKVAS